MASRALALVMVAALVAGCAKTGSDDAGANPTVSATGKAGSPPAGEQLNGTSELVSFESCRGLYGAGEVAPEAPAKRVPREFQLVGLTSRTVATMLFGALCTRASNGQELVAGPGFMLTGVWVRAVNPDWREGAAAGKHFFVLDSVFSNASLLGPFGNMSLNPARGDIAQRGSAVGPADGREIEAVTASSKVSIQSLVATGSGNPEKVTFWLWGRTADPSTFLRTRLDFVAGKPTPEESGGVVLTEGSTATAEAFGAQHGVLALPFEQTPFTFSQSLRFGE